MHTASTSRPQINSFPMDPSPSSASPAPFSSACAFSFSLPFQGSLRARCVSVGVLSFPLLLRSLFASWLSKFSFIFMFISSSFHCPAAAGRVCVCVYHLYRCKTSILCRGARAHFPMLPKLRKMWWMGSWTHNPYLHYRYKLGI